MYLDLYIKELRNNRGLTQQELADALGVSRTTIKNMENGTTTFPQKSVLKALLQYTNTGEMELAHSIIFPKIRYDVLMSHPDYEQFITYMYMNGWNVDYNPMMYDISKTPFFFPGVISKKRDKNATYLVVDFFDYDEIYSGSKSNFNKYLQNFLMMIIETMMNTTSTQFRGVFVVFDECFGDEVDQTQRMAYELFSDLKVNKIAADIQAVLFNTDEETIVEKRKLGK